jgi:hypothetical protein
VGYFAHMMTLHDKLLLVANRYADLTGKSVSAVSRQILNDGKKLSAISSGASLTCSRYEQAMRDFAKEWPDFSKWPADVEWPSDIPRPSVAEREDASAA